MCRGTTCRKPSAIIEIKKYSTNNKKFESKPKNYFQNSTLKTKNQNRKTPKSLLPNVLNPKTKKPKPKSPLKPKNPKK
jgi:hypothetical protein